MIFEELRTLALGAVRFLDATTGLQVDGPLAVSGPGLSFVRNRGGAYVVTDPPVALDEPAEHTLTVRDPLGRYLARRFVVRLPRAADAAGDASLFRAVEVPLFPSPQATVGFGWAVVRASVRDEDGAPVRGALLRVLPAAGGAPLGRGLSDERGEALVPVAGIPVTTWGEGEGPVVDNTIPVTLEAIADPEGPGEPDPDELERRRESLARAELELRLAAGRTSVVTLVPTLA